MPLKTTVKRVGGFKILLLCIVFSKVKSEDDKHAKIVRLLLAHPRINVNKRGSMGETALHSACVDNVESHVGVQLLLSDERCDVNLRNETGNTALIEAVTNVSSHIVAKFNFAKWLPKRKKVDINYVKKHSPNHASNLSKVRHK